MFGVDDALLAAGVSAAANLAGGAMSAGGAAANNAANIQFQREQNQMDAAFQNRTNEDNRLFNWASMDKSMDNSREMFARQSQFSADQAAKAMSFSANEAGLNRQFQEQMSSTAYQRAMADMKKAGLNPILAAGNAGASTPSGSMGSSSMGSAGGSAPSMASSSGSASRGTAPSFGQNSQAEIARALGNLVTSAQDAAKTSENIKLIQEQRDNVHQDTNVRSLDAKTRNYDAQKREREVTGQEIDNDIKEEHLKQEKITTGDMGRYGSARTPGTIERVARTVQGYVEGGVSSPSSDSSSSPSTARRWWDYITSGGDPKKLPRKYAEPGSDEWKERMK